MVDFQLHVNGSQSERITQDIHDIIENGAHKVKVGDVTYVHIKPFLVDIRLDWTMPYGK